MKYTGKQIDTEKYTLCDEWKKGIYEYIARNPENIHDRDNHNNFFFKRTIWKEDIHIGEFLASIIGKKCGFKICDCELYKAQLSKKDSFDVGILSYVNKSVDDILVNPNSIIREFFKLQGLDGEEAYRADIDKIMNAMFAYITKNERPYQEFLNFKQDFIDMVVFDMKYLNPDRVQTNWMMRKNKQSGEIDLYPMFDNEMILGFDEDIPKKDFLDKEIELINKSKFSSITTPKDFQNGNRFSDYRDFMKYLLNKYPIQTQKAIEKTKKFSSEELKYVLEEIDGITELRKLQVIKLFEKREEKINEICNQYEKGQCYRTA